MVGANIGDVLGLAGITKIQKYRSLAMSRRINAIEPNQRFLIVCEGKETEKHYFEAFRVPMDVKPPLEMMTQAQRFFNLWKN
jgi:hypothetical protein